MKNQNKEIVNIQYLILKRGEIMPKMQDFDESNTFGTNSHSNIHIGENPATNNKIGNKCSNNLMISCSMPNLDNFWHRAKFCIKLLFQY